MKKLYIILILVGALVSSCTKENQTQKTESNQRITIKITPPSSAITTTRAEGNEVGTDAENKITNLQILMFNIGYPETVRKIYDFDPSVNHIFDNADRWNATTQSLEIINNPIYGLGSILGIANYKDRFAVGDSKGNISWRFTFYESELTSPFVMYSSVNVPNDAFTSGAELTLKLKRQPIKVEITVKLDEAFAKAYPDVKFGEPSGEKSQMGVIATPNAARFFDPGGVELHKKMISIPYKDMTLSPDGFDKVAFYLCPNLTMSMNPEPATKLALRLPYKKAGSADVVHDNYYTIIIHNNNEPYMPYYLINNTIYRMTATVMGFGSTTPIDMEQNVSVAVEALPWTDGGYDDVIGGAKFEVNRSEINIRGVVNTQLVIKSDDLSKVTFTDYAPLLTAPTIDLVTGVVSVNTATQIGLYTPNYATFKVKYKNISKTITVHAGLWATGNIVYQSGEYINSTDKLANGLYFFSGCNVGLQYGTSNGSVWSAASKYYVSSGGAIVEKTGVSNWDDGAFKTAGDPCALVNPAGAWRLPNQVDYNNLDANRGRREATPAFGQYSYGESVFFRWAGCAVRGTISFYNTNGLYWAQGGRFESYIPKDGNSDNFVWSNSIQAFDNFNIRCVHN